MGAPTTDGAMSSAVDRSPLQATQNIGNTGHNYDTSTATEANSTGGPTKTANMETTYASLIQQYLQVMCLDNATFLAERMVATCSKTTTSLYLLALCHYRSNRPQRAQSVLDECKRHNAATQYLLAKCCFDMEQYGRAEEALLQQARLDYRDYKSASVAERGGDAMLSLQSMDEWILDTSPCPVPNGAAGLHLLANICRRSNRKQRAMEYYRLALKLDPLMWTSYEALCELGAVDLDPTSVFGVRPAELDQFNDQMHKQHDQHHNFPLQERSALGRSFFSHQPHQTPMEAVKPLQPMDLGTPSSTGSLPKASLFQTAHKRSVQKGATPQFQTPNLTPIPIQDASFAPHHHHHAQPAVDQVETASFVDSSNPDTIRRARHVAARLYYPPSPETPEATPMDGHSLFLRGMGRTNLFSFSSAASNTSISETPVRRGASGRFTGGDSLGTALTARRPRALFLSSENKTNNTEPEVDEEDEPNMEEEDQQDETQEKPATTRREELGGHVDPSQIEEQLADEHSGVQEILELLCLLGAAWWRLCQYRCRESLQLFHLLPHVQHNTGWVLHQEGRAYFEMADYQNAQRCLESMQRVEPHRMKGLELLSTVLWQLKKEVELAHLAQRAVDYDRLSPEAWCVVGNCFSLQKEHETALVFFGRSLQLDPAFTYTHTLSGYEYMANEDFDKAVACFRNAIRSDDRHYNAWYGLGAIYHRQEKYDLAEYHFHRAVTINPQSSVLRCNLGMSQYSNGKPFQALDTLGEAFRLDPRNPQARFQRATIYVALNRPEDALKELEKVRDAAPREATIHFALGKVLKRLGRPEQAMRCFLTALDLDPKDNQLIKSAMDKLDEPDVDEEVAAF